jgi:hypothetical protein
MIKMIHFFIWGQLIIFSLPFLYAQEWRSNDIEAEQSDQLIQSLQPEIRQILASKKITFTKTFSRNLGEQEEISVSTPFYVPVNVDPAKYDPAKPLDQATKRLRGLYRCHFTLVNIKGKKYLRLVYISGSEEVFRFTDGILYSDHNFSHNWISKGKFEDFMGVHPEIDQYLKRSQLEQVDQPEPLISIDQIETIQSLIPDALKSDTVGGIQGDQDYHPQRIKILESSSYTEVIDTLPDPQSIQIRSQYTPDFSQLISSYTFPSVFYGTVTSYQYFSKDSSLIYTFHMTDKMNNKGYLAQIYPRKIPLSKWGSPLLEVDAHSGVATPLMEYSNQIHPLYNISTYSIGTSEENWAYIRELGFIQDWYQSLDKPLPDLDNIDQGKIQASIVKAMENDDPKAFHLLLSNMTDFTLPADQKDIPLHPFMSALIITYNDGLKGLHYLVHLKRELLKKEKNQSICLPEQDLRQTPFGKFLPAEIMNIYLLFCSEDFIQTGLDIQKTVEQFMQFEQDYLVIRKIKKGFGGKAKRLKQQKELISSLEKSLDQLSHILTFNDRMISQLRKILQKLKNEKDPYPKLEEVIQKFKILMEPVKKRTSCLL